ncbi:FAD-dependent oxidoreductase [Mycetocola manganoxydans]|nr:oxidoreductase [Mycetocola manganoxydans]GHD42918.1 hypothetical protein GCM10008097_09360 [Mycetocola manganoxydans]
MRRRLETALGRVSMYRLVTVLLVALAVLSGVLSLTGALFFTPLELAAGFAVAVGVSMGSSWLVSRIFRVTSHPESAMITGLLLFFIFRPSIEPADLAGTAVAAIVATASKYLLAVRRRHIFNPAAIGAVVVGVTGLGVSWWWVASGAMLPAVVLAGFLVLYRTRRVALAGVFIAVSAVLLSVRLLTGGGAVADLATVFTSYPVLFFAVFMLTEPLTLPPKRWQQLAEAAIVGVLFSVPFSIGPVFSTPELALVVGNLLAFVAGQRRGIRLVFESRSRLTPTVVELRFRPEKPVVFTAGQYLELSLPHPSADRRGARRMFSMSSVPAAETLTIAYREHDPGSSFKKALSRLEPGDRVTATGVWGDFRLPSDSGVPLGLIAAGIGITPFISQLEDAAAGKARDIVLVYAVPDSTEIAYLDQLERLGVRVLLAAPEPPDVLPLGWTYLGPGRLTGDRLAAAIPDLDERRIFISGPPGLVGALRDVAGRRAKTDAFSGY